LAATRTAHGWNQGLPAIIGLSRHQAQVLGQAYGQLAVHELHGTIRRVVACDRDQVLVQAVVCQRKRQPPTPKPSSWP
jgi:peroxiredoxin